MTDFNSEFFENHDIVQAFTPVDMQSAVNTGDYVDLRPYESVWAVLHHAVGTDDDDAIFSFFEATSAGGAGATALASGARVRHKVGATALSAVGQWTTVTRTAATTYDTDPLDNAQNESIIAVEIKASDLSDGFTHIRVDVADTGGNAQLGAMIYILVKPRYTQATPNSPID